MKKLLFLLTLLLYILSSVGQTIYQAGNYSIMIENEHYYDVTDTTRPAIQFSPDKFLIKLKDPLSSAAKYQFETRHSLTRLKSTKIGVTLYSINEGINFINLLTNLCADNDIEILDLNYFLEFLDDPPLPPTNDNYDFIAEQLEFYDPNFLWAYDITNLYDAWDYTTGNAQIIIGNLDNGVFISHEDLNFGPDNYSNIWTNVGEIPNNGVDEDQNGFVDDYYGWDFGSSDLGDNDVSHNFPLLKDHGTTSAGIMVAKSNNNIGAFGIAGGWNNIGCKVMSIKTSKWYFDNDYAMAECIPFAIEYAVEHGARVINMPFRVYTNVAAIESMIYHYWETGKVTFLAATGNSGANFVSFPASSEYVIAIGGSQGTEDGETYWHGKNQQLSWGTNYGPEVDLVAPVNPTCKLKVIQDGLGNASSGYEYNKSSEAGFAGTSWSVAYTSGLVALMLSIDPCLSNEEIYSILTNTAVKITGTSNSPITYDEYGHSDRVGYGRIECLEAIEACQTQSIGPITTITGIESDKRVDGDIVIENGGELTVPIGKTLRMNPLARIIVKPGGRLIIDGGKITTTCPDMWQGVEVWGDPLLPQIPFSNQGFIWVKNQGTIENAICGIRAYKLDNRNDLKPGGIIKCEEANFINNQVALDFRALPSVNNVSTIINSKFKIDWNYLNWHKHYPEKMYPIFENQIHLSSVEGIDIIGNDFLCEYGYSYDFPYMGIAIYSSSSNFNVIPYCTMTPCEENPKTNTFTGFNYGVYATNDVSLENFKVEQAKFLQTYTSIYANNIPNAKILKNDIRVKVTSTSPFANNRLSTGLYMDACTGYHVEGNELTGGAVLGVNNIGIYVKNSGPSTNYIYNNTFRKVAFGSIAEGYNYNPNEPFSGTGLCYKCNNFYENGLDIAIVRSLSSRHNGIAAYQGSSGSGKDKDTMPAGNIFTQTIGAYHINNNAGDHTIQYYHHEWANGILLDWLIPENSTNLYNHVARGATYDRTSICKSWINKEIPPEEKLLSEYYGNIVAQDSIKDSILRLRDGGNTDEMIETIETSFPSDAFILRDQLLTDSPYLSDTTLKVVIENELVLNNALLRDVLVANPHAGKSNSIMSKIEDRTEPMPDDMILEIEESSETLSAYERMLESYATHNHKRYRAFNDLLELYLTEDNEINQQGLINLADSDSSLFAELILIRYYMSHGLLGEALSRSNQLDSKFVTIDSILFLKNQLVNFIEIYQSEYDSACIDSAQLVTLDNLVLNGQYPINIWAEGFSSYIQDSIRPEEYILPVPGELQNSRIIPQAGREEHGNQLTFYPNPTKDYIIVSYSLKENTSNNKLRVRTVDGKLISETKITGNNNQKTLNLKDLTSGLYIIELISNSKISSSGKFQILN